MIPYSRDSHEIIPTSSVKIIGIGGAGANMLRRIATDGVPGTELLALNTDTRTLAAFNAGESIQLGVNLTKGLGSGGDPELGQQAVLEAEDEVRAAIRGHRIVFLCVGLGGGTGSGAAPIVTRIAREEGAFVVVFASMPFSFEGRRRMDQAESSLNQLAVLANALVTFDNNRMGELVVAQQGVHEAFSAADQMICESIKAVIRLVIRPGLINIGLDDLMSALRTNRSRCLFGSGIASGENRATLALQNALSSPLLDQGALLKQAQTVLVHLCGGKSLTLFEIESLMQSLQQFVPASAHVLFGASVDPTLGDALSLTLISALPEDSLSSAPRGESLARAAEPLLAPIQGFTPPPAAPAPISAPAPIPDVSEISTAPPSAPPQEIPAIPTPPSLFEDFEAFTPPTPPSVAQFVSSPPPAAPPSPEISDDSVDRFPPPIENDPIFDEPLPENPSFSPIPRKRPAGILPWSANKDPEPAANSTPADSPQSEDAPEIPDDSLASSVLPSPVSSPEPEPPKLKLSSTPRPTAEELSFDTAPRGRFEGADPNLIDGEDIDIPAFLRRR